MNWLVELAESYRTSIRSGLFFQQLDKTFEKEQINFWVRQLFYQSREFTVDALPQRYKFSQEKMDVNFRSMFAKHQAEEDKHCDMLLDWMRREKFLKPDEDPTSVPPTLETLAVSGYCFRSIVREPAYHQIITLNLISEGVSLDFFTAVIPVLKRLNLYVSPYWTIHEEVDKIHQNLGLELIPEAKPDSAQGQEYQQILKEAASFYQAMLDSWAIAPSLRLAVPEEQSLSSLSLC